MSWRVAEQFVLVPPSQKKKKKLSHFNNLIWRDWGQRTTWFPQSHSFTWPCRLQSGSARLSSPAPTWLTDGCEPALTDHWRGKPSAPQERHKLQVTATGGSETSAGCSDRREIYLSVCRSVWDCRTPRVTEMIWRKCICIRRNTLRFRNLVLIHLPDTNETHPELTGTFLTLSFEVYFGNISVSPVQFLSLDARPFHHFLHVLQYSLSDMAPDCFNFQTIVSQASWFIHTYIYIHI